MTTQRTLSELRFSLWVCRNCGSEANRFDRANKRNEIRREARAILIRNLSADCPQFQREGLNRRQRRAEADGVAVLRRGQVCGIPFAIQPWGSK